MQLLFLGSLFNGIILVPILSSYALNPQED